MQDKIIVITGGSDGIGKSAARQLSQQGAKVVIVGRSPEKTKNVATELGLAFFIADFARLDEVKKLGKALLAEYPRIDVLINNAGGIFGEREVTIDGYEKTMQVNHLAHFLLVEILRDRLIASRATIINTSSVAHKVFAKFDINDLNVEHQYTPSKAYGNAKLENILFTKELDRRYGSRGISAVAFHPGKVQTNFANETTSFLRLIYNTPLGRIAGLVSAEKGADTMVWLATSKPGVDWQRGAYYVQRKKAHYSKLADDPEVALSLWEQSEGMLEK